MAEAFRVESVSFCDYITEDSAGKPILVGVYNGEIRFAEEPANWPIVYMCMVIDPQEDRFKISIDFNNPDDKLIMRVFGSYSSPERPPQENRLILNVQMPPIKFTGAGTYSLKVIENDARIVLNRAIPVHIGSASQFVPDINLEVNIPGGIKGAQSSSPALFSQR